MTETASSRLRAGADRRIQGELDASFRRSLRPIFGWIALLYAFFAAVDPFYLPAPANRITALLDGTLAAGLVALWWAARRRLISDRAAHPAAFAVATFALANATLLLHLTRDPINSIYSALIVLGVAVFFLSANWYILFLSLVAMAWTVNISLLQGVPGIAQASFSLFAAVVVGSIVIAVRLSNLRRLEALRLSGEARQCDLDATVGELQQSEQRFRTLSDASLEGICIHDRGRIIEANHAFAQLFEYPPRELIGMEVVRLVDAASRARVEAQLAHPSDEPYEVQCRTKQGNPVLLEVRGRTLPYRGREARVVSVRDVGEQRRAEDAERTTLRQSLEIDHLKEVNALRSQMLNALSHELNTPMTPIKIQLHLLANARSGPLTPAQAGSIDILRRNLGRLESIIQEALDVARIESGKLKLDLRPVGVQDVVMDAAATFLPVAEEAGVRFEVTPEEDATVAADPRRLIQIVGNLLSNAFKCTPRGGTVELSTRVADGRALVRVRDTGVGLRPDQIERLFQPFSQVHDDGDPARSGTGLGLHICRGIIEAHGGRIWAESPGEGRGSTFSFELGVVGAAPSAPTPLPVSGEPTVRAAHQ